MTTLRDPFAVTHEKNGFTYVSWSQVADRLDEVDPTWSFAVVQLGEDWCLGRLTIAGRTFENVGYAENSEKDWKKEVLKDAISDAFKRCAALAGVARYLYDKDAPVAAHSTPRSAAPVPSEPDYLREAERVFSDVRAETQDRVATKDGFCPDHGLMWALRPGGVSKTTGKAYDPFWSCPSQDRPFCKQKPSARWAAAHEGGAS